MAGDSRRETFFAIASVAGAFHPWELMVNRVGVASAIILLAVMPAAHAQATTDTPGGFDIKFEGLIQADANWYDSDIADLDGDPDDGSSENYDLRNAQFYLKGKGPEGLDWVVGYEAKSRKWLDVNVRYRLGGREQSLQVGQFKQPNGLEALSSTKHNDFQSQAMVTNTFAIGRRLGVAYSYGHSYDRTRGEAGNFKRHGNWGLIAGYFGRELTDDLARGSGLGFRSTWALFNTEKSILHLGVSYVKYDTPDDTVRLRARPSADLTPIRLVDTGALADTDELATLGAEMFWVHGRFKLQAEYMTTHVDRYRAGSEDLNGTGGYVSGIWNIYGQSWGYKDGEPALRVGSAAGVGMWQLGVRYDVLDLNDNAVRGGRMETWTAGVNWYWGSNFKLLFNYVMAESERSGVKDEPNIVEARLQLHW